MKILSREKMEVLVHSICTNLNRDVYFYSDTHFSHKNILKYNPCRKMLGDSLEEYDNNLIDVWNKTIPKTGVVFFLGDFGLGNKTYLLSILERLNGVIFFCQGNHDSNKFVRKYGELDNVLIMDRRQYISIGGVELLLSHKPQDNLKGEVFNIHGHEHYEKPTNISWKRFNVSLESCLSYNNSFAPISWGKIKKLQKKT